jgi:response regulator RpfG family c-di-GMP phosphodiesterase
VAGSLATPKSKAADLLLRAQLLQKATYEHVLSLVRENNERAEEVLLEQDLFSEADLLKALSGIYRTHFVSTDKLSKADIPRATVQMIPRRVAETLGVFPVLFDPRSSVLSVVTPDPDNADMLREVQLVSGAKEVKAFVARPAAVNAAIRKHHGGEARAFDALRTGGLGFQYGQQVTHAAPVRDSLRRNEASFPHTPPAPPPAARNAPSPPPAPGRRASVTRDDDLEELEMPSMPPPPRHAPPPEFDGPSPTRADRRSLRQPTNNLSLSLPPPPAGQDAAGRSAPAAHARQAPAPAPAPPPAPASTPPSHGSMAPYSRGMASMPPQMTESARQQAFANDVTVELLTVMVSLLENSRQELRGHSSQVARLLKRVAERMNLDRDATYGVVVAGHIHDLGKMGQFHLTALNCSEYEGHRVAAQKAYDTPLRLLEGVHLPRTVRDAVFHMYERFDGRGFPDKLVGKEIPLGARLLAASDTYADLTQNPRNPFRKVLGPAEAMNVLMEHKGTIFDPGILDLFKALVLGEDMKAKLLANRYRALIVDPDPEESTVLELRMVEQGFDVKTARSVDAARKLLSGGDVELDLVVSELELPDGNGLSFLAEARRERWGRDMPWVFHTQKQGRAEAQKAFDLAAMDFVAKPVQADVLVAKLKAMLDQQSAKRGPKGVSGSLREMGLPDIVQVLFHGRKTGKLNISAAGKRGEIHFLEGNIADALLGEVTGANAFYAMLKFDDGDFALDPSFKPAKRLIEESSEALLLEGMRRMDEGL